jgi:HK97 family phage prohead protease
MRRGVDPQEINDLPTRRGQELRAAALVKGDSKGSAVELRRRKASMLRKTVERRVVPTVDIELRHVVDEDCLRFAGYAALFDTDYEVHGFTERISPGAFARSLKDGPDVVLTLDHGRAGSGLPLARTTAGTLRLTEDERGLRVEADLDRDDPDADLLAMKIKNGALDQMSFAFICHDDIWDSEYKHRTVRQAGIHRGDVSVVTHAANPNTVAVMRSRRPSARRLPVGERLALRATQERQLARVKALRKAAK